MAARSVPQPPYSTDLLADLHADNVPPDFSEQLWPQVHSDPEALRFLRSLDDVTAELRALGEDSTILHPIPPEVSSRLDRFLDDLAHEDAPDDRGATIHHLPFAQPPDTPPATRPIPAVEASDTHEEPIRLEHRRPRRLRWLAAAAAAVAVVAGTLIAVDAVRGHDATRNALPTSETGAVAIGDDLPVATLLSAMGRQDITGPLAQPGALIGCLTAVGYDRTVLGKMNATFQGQPALLVLLTGPNPPKITALIVGTGCSAADNRILKAKDIG